MPHITGEKVTVPKYRSSLSQEVAENGRISMGSPTDSWLGGSYTSENPETDVDEESSRPDSALSTRSLYSNNSDESLDEHMKDVTDDLNEMLLKVENLQASQTIYDSATEDLEGMIKDAGKIRNSLIMSEEFNILSLGEKDFLKADQDFAKKRYSSYLSPTDAPNPHFKGIRKAVSSEVLPIRKRAVHRDSQTSDHPTNGSLLHSGHGIDMDDQMRSSTPIVDEKVGGTTHTLKIIVVGDAGVGKSSLIHQLTHHKFNEKVLPTLGVDFSAKNLPAVDDSVIRLHLWDVAGQERYRCLSRAYLKGCQACVVVFDATRKDTFKHVEVWKKDIDTKCGPIPSLLLGNKNDLQYDISQRELQRVSDFLNFTSCAFISAKKFAPLVAMVQNFAQKVKKEISEAAELDENEELCAEKKELKANLINLSETMARAKPSTCLC